MFLLGFCPSIERHASGGLILIWFLDKPLAHSQQKGGRWKSVLSRTYTSTAMSSLGKSSRVQSSGAVITPGEKLGRTNINGHGPHFGLLLGYDRRRSRGLPGAKVVRSNSSYKREITRLGAALQVEARPKEKIRRHELVCRARSPRGHLQHDIPVAQPFPLPAIPRFGSSGRGGPRIRIPTPVIGRRANSSGAGVRRPCHPEK